MPVPAGAGDDDLAQRDVIGAGVHAQQVPQEWRAGLAPKARQVDPAGGVTVLQRQLPVGIRPRASTGIRYVVGSYDLGRHAAPPLSATRLVRQRLSDEGKDRPLGPGFLHNTVG